MSEAGLKQKTIATYKSNVNPTWCPGCGDFSVLACVYKALLRLEIEPHNAVIVSGIGCSSRFPVFTTCYGFHGIHGRILPTAIGIKLANPSLTVIGAGGDGDGLAIGAGHFVHAGRRNLDMTYIMMDNLVYGLTKGQASPTTTPDDRFRSLPYGFVEEPLNPVGLALALGFSFVARAFSGNPNELTDLIVEAIKHKGFSFLHVLSPCVVFNDTYEYYRKKTQPVPKEHNPEDIASAIKLWQTKGIVYTGIFYKVRRTTLEERLEHIRKIARENDSGDIEALLKEFI